MDRALDIAVIDGRRAGAARRRARAGSGTRGPDALLVRTGGIDPAVVHHVAVAAARHGPLPVLVAGPIEAGWRLRLLAEPGIDLCDADVSPGELALRLARLSDRVSYTLGPLQFHRLDALVRSAAGSRRLTGREAALLHALIGARGSPLSAAALRHAVLGIAFDPETNGLAVHLHRLRAKLADIRIRAVTTMRGHGYALDRHGLGLPPLDALLDALEDRAAQAAERRHERIGHHPA